MRFRITFLFLLASWVQLFADPFVRFEENGKVGLKDERGNVVIPATFEALGWSDGNFSVIGQITGYKQMDRWGLINLQKQFITPADFESLTYPGGDRLIVSRKINPFLIKYGCVDLAGKVTVPFHYDGIKVAGLRAVVFIRNGTNFEYGLIDLNDKGIIPPHYHQINPIGTLRYAVEGNDLKTALFSEDGNQLTGFVIDSISAFHKGLAIVYQNFAQGVIDREGQIKVNPDYRQVRIEPDGKIATRGFDEWRILDFENHELQKIRADELDPSAEKVYRISLAGKIGLANEDLNIILPVHYDFLGENDYGKRVAGLDHHYGVIRKDNSIVLPISADSVYLNGNFIRVGRRLNQKMSWMLYDTFGIVKTHSSYEFLGRFNGRFFPVKKRGYWGALNRYGEEVVNCVFDSLIEFRGSQIVVEFRGDFGIIDEREKWLVAPQSHRVSLVNENLFLEKIDSNVFLKDFDGHTIYFTSHSLSAGEQNLREISSDGTGKRISFQGLEIKGEEQPQAIWAPVQRSFETSEGMIGIQKDGKYGFVDLRGRLRIANRYDDIGEFHEGLAPIKLIGKWGYVSVNDQIAINPNFESVQPFIRGIAIVTRSGKFGLIDKSGNAILPTRYDSITRLADQTFLLRASSLFGLADPAGRENIEPRFENLQNLQNGFLIVSRDGKSGLLTTAGLSTIPMIYDKLVYDPARNKFLALKRSAWILN